MMKMWRAALVLVAALSLMAFGAVGCGDDDDDNGSGGSGEVSESDFMDSCMMWADQCIEDEGEGDDMDREQYCDVSYQNTGAQGSACQAAHVDFYECMAPAGCEDGQACSAEIAAQTQACE